MNYSNGSDEYAPPAKRLKLGLDHADKRDMNNNMGQQSKSDVRKRKVAVKRPLEKKILDLNPHVILEMLKHLPLNDLCNVAQSHVHLKELAFMIFKQRYRNGFRMRPNAINLLIRVLTIFGDLIAAVDVSLNRGH